MKSAFSRSGIIVAALILGLAGCASTQTGEKTGEYVDDAWITTKVKSELAAESETKASNISVETTNGKVTLTGKASTWNESDMAAKIARNIKGVTGVQNDIRIQ
jgi:osmotically-inducible protein OsmY